LIPHAFGWIEVEGYFSKRRCGIPRNDKRMEELRPTGPPPTMMTEVELGDAIVPQCSTYPEVDSGVGFFTT
jgi:hypothetical protein